MESSQSQAILDALANLSRQTEKQAENFAIQLSEQAAKVSKLTTLVEMVGHIMDIMSAQDILRTYCGHIMDIMSKY